MSEENINSFEGLQCWKACRVLRLFITQEVIPQLPKDERFRLSDQLYRSARSTTANTVDESLIPQSYLDRGRALIEQANKIRNGYINYLKRSANPPLNQ